ncbi:MAG: GNAT family N-acetyltransferase [Dehalococcoidales bacterium]|nr:MAG: GNAT family N-acetyltransferase [Dehalococcoidales bacterium]
MAKIEYTHTDEQGLDSIAALWQKLLEYHKSLSQHFSGRLGSMTFDLRKKGLLEKSREGVIRIDLARDVGRGGLVGYCVSTISRDRQGEIESIYIEPDYRESGIGDNLMKRALHWMDEYPVTKKVLAVGTGNEEVFDFYSRYDFYPRTTILEQIEAGEGE